MEKKHPNKFTIGFNGDDPSHRKVVDILNHTKEKADLITAAVLNYLGEDSVHMVPGISLESLQPMIQKLVQQEIQKTAGHTAPPPMKEEPEVIDLSANETHCIDPKIAKNMFSAMEAFRKM